MNGLDKIIKEYKDIIKYPIANCGILVGLFNENDFRKWRVTLLGPKDTSYKGGLFYLSVTFPEEYPNRPPEICFLTPIYHVNVNPHTPRFSGSDSLGHVCLSTLNWWKPYYTMREILTNIFALLYFGNPDTPYDMNMNNEFRENRPLFEEKVKFFTKKYANPMKGIKYTDSNKDWDFSYSK